jgi:hypothetical protein
MMMVLKAGLVVVVLSLLSVYTYHVWSDCLDDNSVITCMRMLSR